MQKDYSNYNSLNIVILVRNHSLVMNLIMRPSMSIIVVRSAVNVHTKSALNMANRYTQPLTNFCLRQTQISTFRDELFRSPVSIERKFLPADGKSPSRNVVSWTCLQQRFYNINICSGWFNQSTVVSTLPSQKLLAFFTQVLAFILYQYLFLLTFKSIDEFSSSLLKSMFERRLDFIRDPLTS